MVRWVLLALCFGLDRKKVHEAACALESFVVEEASVKRSMIELLEAWDRDDTFHIVVLNGYFATGKTYISSVLSKLLSQGGNPVEIFVSQDSIGSSKAYHDKINAYFDSGKKRGGDNGQTDHQRQVTYPTFVFDDLPCWKDKTRVLKTLEKCMQFPEFCRGALFVITSNDGWCDQDYCNHNVELDRMLGTLLKKERELDDGDTSDDVKECVIEGVQISREECDFRGCTCEGSAGFCDRCMVKKSDYRLFDQLRKASAERGSQYIVSRLNEYPHLTVLGHNAYWSEPRSHAHFAKLIERMLAHAVIQDLKQFDIRVIYPQTFSKQLAELSEEKMEGEMARRLRQLSHSLVRGPVRGECGGACAKVKEMRTKLKVPLDSPWSLYMWCETNSSSSPCVVRHVVVPWKNPKNEDYLYASFVSHMGESVRPLLQGFFSPLKELVTLYLRQRRPVSVMQSLADNVSEARNMLQRDAEELTKTVDRILEEWKVDCPHLQVNRILVVSPVTLPAECNTERHREIFVVPRECTLSAAPKLGELCTPRALIPNPFYGSVVLQLGTYSVFNPKYWMRNQHKRQCDSMNLNIHIATMPVVASWHNPLPIRAPEIPSSQKQGCQQTEDAEDMQNVPDVPDVPDEEAKSVDEL